MRNWSSLLVAVLTAALTIHPISAENDASPNVSPAEITTSLHEAGELWIKKDYTHALPNYQNLLRQGGQTFGKASPTLGLGLFRTCFVYCSPADVGACGP